VVLMRASVPLVILGLVVMLTRALVALVVLALVALATVGHMILRWVVMDLQAHLTRIGGASLVDMDDITHMDDKKSP
jgi:hypothetical protein